MDYITELIIDIEGSDEDIIAINKALDDFLGDDYSEDYDSEDFDADEYNHIEIDEMLNIESKQDAFEFGKMIARVASRANFTIQGTITDCDDYKMSLILQMAKGVLTECHSDFYKFIPKNAVEEYDDFCRYIGMVFEEDFQLTKEHNTYFADGKIMLAPPMTEPIELEYK